MKRRGAVSALGLLALVWALVGPGLTPTDVTARSVCMTVLDVGQGDAILLELQGQHWLVDGGGAPGTRRDLGVERVLPALRARGIDRLDRVVLTHGDADHIGGLFAVLEQLEVGALVVPTRGRVSGAERMLIGLAERRGVAVHVVDEGAELGPLPGAVHGRLLHPRPGWTGPNGDRNAGSVVFVVGLGGVDFLLTGDIEAETERELVALGLVPRSAVLKLAHHGSRTSTTPVFLDAVDPLVAVAGAGRDNRFGFPHRGVTSRLDERDTRLFWTGRDGPVRVCTDGFGLRATAADPRRPLAAPWSATSAEVAAWRSTRPSAPPAGLHVAAPGATGPKGARTARRRAHRARAPARAKAPEPRAPQAVPPPTLLSTKEWERKRRSSRMKAPWK